MNEVTYAFIDASNLFYGGVKTLGWNVDYEKLYRYLGKKYNVSRVLYFGGIDIYGFNYNYLRADNVIPEEVLKYLHKLIRTIRDSNSENKLNLLNKSVERVKFYIKLKLFGYELYLKPVKNFVQEDGSIKKRANCDVEMTFWIMKEISRYSRVIILSGDGDFFPLLRYLKRKNKEVIILARGNRTAREIRQFAGENFRDFVRLKKEIEYKKRQGHTKYPCHV